MSELQELYQEIVMEHNRQPRNFRELQDPNRTAEGFNPFCGDVINLKLKVAEDMIEDVGFQGSGCAISRASASMMTESIKGKSAQEAQEISDAFRRMITLEPAEASDPETLGDLEVLEGVSEFPVRVKCATLAWHTLMAALRGEDETVKTE